MNGVVQNLLFHQNCVSNEKQIIDTFQHKMSTNWNLSYLFFVKYNTTRHTEARQEERKEENRREKKRTEQNRREERRREGTAKEGRGEDRRRGRGEEKRGEQRRGDEGEERKGEERRGEERRGEERRGEERRGEERRGEIINITKGTTSEDKYSAIVNGSLTTDLDLRSSDVISHNVCCVPVNVTSVFHSP